MDLIGNRSALFSAAGLAGLKSTTFVPSSIFNTTHISDSTLIVFDFVIQLHCCGSKWIQFMVFVWQSCIICKLLCLTAALLLMLRGERIIYDGRVIDKQKVLQDVNETDRMDQERWLHSTLDTVTRCWWSDCYLDIYWKTLWGLESLLSGNVG